MFRLILIILISINTTKGWDFSHLQSNLKVLHVSVFKNRAFISVNSVKNNIDTLIEGSWPESSKTIAKPYVFKEIEQQDECSKIHQSVTSDIDKMGRLWVIDSSKTRHQCPSKLLIINLYKNIELQRCDFKGIGNNEITSIVVDTVLAQGGTRAYIALNEVNQMLVYAIKERRWWRVSFTDSHMKPCGIVAALAMKKGASELLLVEKQTGVLYSVGLNQIRNSHGPMAIIGNEVVTNVTVKRIGNLLGAITTLVVDPKGLITYVLLRDNAIVRCDPKKPLIAENHLVIMQGSVSSVQLFMDSLGALWALKKKPNDLNKYCNKVLKYYWLSKPVK